MTAGESSYDAILEELLSAMESAAPPPSRIELLERHPGSEATVDRVLRAVERYARLRGQARVGSRLGPPLAPGTMLGDFVLDEPLAAGGMARVYRARQRSLGNRVVALKVFVRGADEEHGHRRFEREALSASRLHHPHLAEVYGFGEQDGLCFYAMRLVAGPTWRAVLERLVAEEMLRRYPVVRRTLVRQAAEVASALATIHAAGMVHRDVKPSNVLLDGSDAGPGGIPEAAAILVDFGLVRPVDRGLLTMTRGSGTACYAAPEQLLGSPVGPPADVFALGVTLHDLLSARTPEARTIAPSIGMESLRELVPSVDPDLAAVVSKAVDPDARWRYADAEALRRDLSAWLEGRPVSARRLRPVERARRFVGRHPQVVLRGILGSAAAAVLLAGLAAVWGWAAAWRRAATARTEGDVATLTSSLGSVPYPVAWLLGATDRSLLDYVRRLRGSESSDPVVAVASCLERGASAEALLAAATHLRVHGYDQEPLVRDWLLLQLSPDSDRRREALQVTARIFYERDDQDQAELVAREPFRQALLGLWEAPTLAEEERLYALSALSGCARVSDLGRVLPWCLPPPDFTERQRLGLRCAERTLRRSNRLRTASASDLAEVRGLVATHIRRMLDEISVDPHVGPWDCRLSAWRLGIALLLAERAAGIRPPVDGLLPPSWLDAFLTQGAAPGSGEAALFFAAAGDPRTRPAMELTQGPRSADRWGQICGLLDDPDVTERSRRFFLKSGEPDGLALVAEFDRAVAESSPELSGRADRFLLDPESRLGAVVGRLASSIDAERAEYCPDPQVMGAWDFTTPAPSSCGIAGELDLAEADHNAPDPGSICYLRLPAAGRSSAEVEFSMPPVGASSPWVALELTHCRASRPYLPYQGEVYLRIRLDGTVLFESVAVESTAGQTVSLPIEGLRLRPGNHRLEIAPTTRSTSTYRLYRATLRRMR